MNNLNVRFGSSPQNPNDAIGIAFVSAPYMQPDFSVALLETFRFAKENFPGIRDYSIVEAFGTSKIRLEVNYAGTSLLSTVSGLGLWNLDDDSLELDLTETNFKLTGLNSQIGVRNVKVTNADSWGVTVTPGVVFRSYTTPSYEESDVWFRQIPGLSGNDGLNKACILIYSVPESSYQPSATQNNLSFPGSEVKYRYEKEKVPAIGPNSIALPPYSNIVQTITVNGVLRYELATGNTSFVKKIDDTLHTIEVRGGVSPADEIYVGYQTYVQNYTYTGFRNKDNVYYPLDLNPEYGHFIGDDRYGAYRASSSALLEEVTVYAIPSAVATFSVEDPSDISGLPKLVITFHSAFDYGETHFIRHTVGLQLEDIVPRISDTPANTYGFALFGRNYYDEPTVPRRDIFSLTHPSMLPLARLVLKAPLNVSAVKTADIRVRGGGIPEYFDFDMLRSEPDTLATVKGYYDVGIWEGQAVQEGGYTTINIDKSVLVANGGQFTEQEVAEIVRDRIPPGIEYEINFQDVR